MRRILWLLLALSLPAWATINAITSTRILTPCAEGQRDAAYPSGGACNPPAAEDYLQSWPALSVSTNAYSAIKAEPWTTIGAESKSPTEDPNAYQITSSECRDNDNRALYMRNDGTIAGSDGKRRQEVRHGKGLTGYDRTIDGTEYWYGWSKKIPSASWPKASEAGGGSKSVISGQFKTNGGPMMYMQIYHDADSDGKVRLMFHLGSGATEASPTWTEYYYKKGTTGDGTSETGITNSTVSSNDDFPLNEWVDIVMNFKMDPVGTSGFLRVWIIENGHKTLFIERTGIQMNFADMVGVGAHFEEGMYFSDSRSFVYKMYYDAYRAADGASGYDTVAPSGTPCS